MIKYTYTAFSGSSSQYPETRTTQSVISKAGKNNQFTKVKVYTLRFKKNEKNVYIGGYVTEQKSEAGTDVFYHSTSGLPLYHAFFVCSALT